MNVLHMKYAVEVARCGSINKAAEILMVGQPNISRAIKELESTVGTAIFLRTAKGMKITAEGEIFLRYANSILKQMDEIEEIFKKNSPVQKTFSIWTRGAAYIYRALGMVCQKADRESFISIEADNRTIIQGVENGECRQGLIRIRKDMRERFEEILFEKGIDVAFAADFTPCVTVGKNNTVQSTEVLPSEIREDEKAERGIYVPSAIAREEILRKNTSAFMLSVPAPKEYCRERGLVQITCKDMPAYTDMLIRKKELRPTDTEIAFEKELRRIFADVIDKE